MNKIEYKNIKIHKINFMDLTNFICGYYCVSRKQYYDFLVVSSDTKSHINMLVDNGITFVGDNYISKDLAKKQYRIKNNDFIFYRKDCSFYLKALFVDETNILVTHIYGYDDMLKKGIVCFKKFIEVNLLKNDSSNKYSDESYNIIWDDKVYKILSEHLIGIKFVTNTETRTLSFTYKTMFSH